MEIGHAILRKIWVVKQYLKFKENWTAWMWSGRIENETISKQKHNIFIIPAMVSNRCFQVTLK